MAIKDFKTWSTSPDLKSALLVLKNECYKHNKPQNFQYYFYHQVSPAERIKVKLILERR